MTEPFVTVHDCDKRMNAVLNAERSGAISHQSAADIIDEILDMRQDALKIEQEATHEHA